MFRLYQGKYWLLSLFLLTFSANVFTQTIQEKRKAYQGSEAKYVFLMIGDGMGLAQITVAEVYLAALQNDIAPHLLSFSDFPSQGFMTTHAYDRYITGSAASGTAIATGHKTSIGTISMGPKHKIKYKSVATKAHEKGLKVGILTTVPIDHATPAVFYANEPVRHSNYNIGRQLPLSGFDYFAGGGFTYPDGRNHDQENLVALLKNYGYNYIDTKKDFQKLSPGDGKVLAVNPVLEDGAMPYRIDQTRNDITLADFTAKGIEMIDNETGFFMMVEGGQIDWAAHANDAATLIREVLDFDEAVAEALKFYKNHLNETLIVVTADHETGGMALGGRNTKYSSYFDRLKNQKVSMNEFGRLLKQYATAKAGTFSFEDALDMASKYFGLGKKNDGLMLNKADLVRLRKAYEAEFEGVKPASILDEMAVSYNGNYPFASVAVQILNEKSGVSFTSNSHTGIPVPVKAIGPGAELFDGLIDNTDISKNIEVIMGLNKK
jgi:alkaline phosphatase